MWKTVPGIDGTGLLFGGEDLSKASNLFNGVLDVDTVIINSPFKFKNGKLEIRNAADTASTTFSSTITGNHVITLQDADGTMAYLANLLDKSKLNTAIVYNDQNNNLGAFYEDIAQIATPANPSAGTRRLFVDSGTGKLSVRTSGGVTVSLEESGAGSNEFADNLFRITDDGDATKKIAFQASGITTGTTRTLTMPDADGTIDLINFAQTFSVRKTWNVTADKSIQITANTYTGGESTSTGGAVNITTTGSQGAGLVVYSNNGSFANGHLIVGRADNSTFGNSVFYGTSAGASHTALFLYTGTDSASSALNLVSSNPNFTAFQVSGQELAHGTIKVTHTKPTGADTNAAGLSIDLQGSGTAAQGIFVNSSVAGGTTGKLLNMRNDGVEYFSVTSAGDPVIRATNKLFIDGAVGVGGNTYLQEISADVPRISGGEKYADFDFTAATASQKAVFAFAHTTTRTYTLPDTSGTFLLTNQAITVDANARVAVSKNSGATIGTRRRINLIEGTNITLTIADDGVNEEVDITINGSAGGGPEFADSVFRITDDGDSTKKIAFQASGITTGTVRTLTVQNFDGTIAVIDQAQTYTAGKKQTFSPDATNAGINVGSVAGDPSTLTNGDIWYDSTGNKWRVREGGVSKDVIQTGGSTHNLLSATHTDTATQTVSRGSLIVGKTATPVWDELIIGGANTVLASDGTDATWTTLAKAHLPASIAYEDEANIFTQDQQISKSNATAELDLDANHTTPASGQVSGLISFRDNDSLGGDTEYGAILVNIEVPTNGSEEGSMELLVNEVNNSATYLSFNKASNRRIKALRDIEIQKTGTTPTLIFDRPEIVADGTLLGEIRITGFSDSSVARTYSHIKSTLVDDVNTLEDASLYLGTMQAGTLKNFILLNNNGDGLITFNADESHAGFNVSGVGILDFINDSGHTISDTISIFRFNVLTGDTFAWRVNAVDELTLSATVLDVKNNSIQNASMDMTNITITGTKAQFNTALSDDDFDFLATDQTITAAKTFTIADTVNKVPITVNQNDVTNNPRGISIVNAGTAASLFIDPNGATSTSTSVGGAILLENTGNHGAGLVIYSNDGASATGRLVNIRADNVAFAPSALHVDYDGTGNAVEIVHAGSDASANALNVVSTNPLDTTVGISGTEEAKGTVKITHTKPTNADSNASALSISLEGVGTASQGIFLDSPATTTGKLVNIRNNAIEYFTITSAGDTVIKSGSKLYLDGATGAGTAAFLDLASSILRFNVATANTFSWRINAADVMTLTTSALNVASGIKVQENGTNISPIGLHDVWRGADSMAPTITAGCQALEKNETATNKVNYQALNFDQTTEENAFFTTSLPRNWNNGTIKVTFYWTAAAGTGGVAWGIKGAARSNDDALDQAWGTEVITTDTLIATGDVHTSAQSTAVTLAGTPADADYLVFNIARKTGDAGDTLTADAKLLGISIEFTLDAAVAA